MARTLFFGNLSYATTDADLSRLVAQYAEVISARVATDRDTGRSRGFGFVEVPDDAADAVVIALNEQIVDGRPLTVNEARPREPRYSSSPRGPRAQGSSPGRPSSNRSGGRRDGGRW